jgi:hypothetical protein
LLEDIEKLIKRKLPVSALPIASSGIKAAGTTKPIAADPFFFMPYEPNKEGKDVIAETASSVNKPKLADGKNKKPVLGALLGGAKK